MLVPVLFDLIVEGLFSFFSAKMGMVIKMGLQVQMAIRRNTLYIRLNGELDPGGSTGLRSESAKSSINTSKHHSQLPKLNFMDSGMVIIGRYSQIRVRKAKLFMRNERYRGTVFNLSGLKNLPGCFL